MAAGRERSERERVPHDGFLCHRISEGDPIEPDTVIATIVKPENPVPLEFALRRIHQGDPYDTELLMSAITLCEYAEDIENVHLLRCLDYGAVAEWGARGLYAKTRRDGIGRFKISDGFSADRGGWESYLSSVTGKEDSPRAADI